MPVTINNGLTREQALTIAMSDKDISKMAARSKVNQKTLNTNQQELGIAAMVKAFAEENYDVFNVARSALTGKAQEQFTNWLKAHAPVRVANTKAGKSIRKDTSEDAVAFNFDGAQENPWYNFETEKGEQMDKILSMADLNKSVENLIKKYTKALENNSVPADEVEQLQNTVEYLQGLASNDVEPVAQAA